MNDVAIAKVGRFLVLAAAMATLGATFAAAGCGGSDTLTKGSFCSQTGAATCDRAVMCTLVTSAERSQCLTEFQGACCGDDMSCGDTPTDPAQETALRQILSSCVAAFKTFDCSSLEAGDSPAECGGGAALQRGALTSAAPPATSIAKAGAVAGRSFSAP
jgi:hypothetical protein